MGGGREESRMPDLPTVVGFKHLLHAAHLEGLEKGPAAVLPMPTRLAHEGGSEECRDVARERSTYGALNDGDGVVAGLAFLPKLATPLRYPGAPEQPAHAKPQPTPRVAVVALVAVPFSRGLGGAVVAAAALQQPEGLARSNKS